MIAQEFTPEHAYAIDLAEYHLYQTEARTRRASLETWPFQDSPAHKQAEANWNTARAILHHFMELYPVQFANKRIPKA